MFSCSGRRFFVGAALAFAPLVLAGAKPGGRTQTAPGIPSEGHSVAPHFPYRGRREKVARFFVFRFTFPRPAAASSTNAAAGGGRRRVMWVITPIRRTPISS